MTALADTGAVFIGRRLMTDEIQVGAVTQTHGLKGEVKVFPTTDEPERFEELEWVSADNGRGREKLYIESVRYFKQFVILKFRGKDSIEEVQQLKGAKLVIPRESAVSLEDGEYLIPDLIGMKVVEDTGKVLGELSYVMQTGANDVYAVKTADGGEILLPAIDSCILDVDTDNDLMTVHLMEGLT